MTPVTTGSAITQSGSETRIRGTGNGIRATDSADKLAYIDNARGIAILLVILVHCNQPIEGLSPLAHAIATYGQSGVQLFFVASAFTLCLSHHRRTGEATSNTAFLLRRIFRIAPLYYVGILLYLGAHLLEQVNDPASQAAQAYTPWNIVSNVLLIHGFVPSANNSVVPGGWSIGTEMAFYCLFPFLFAGFSRLRRHGILPLIAALVTVICANLLLQAWLLQAFRVDIGNNSFVFYHLVNQLPVFLLGLTFFFVTDVPHPATDDRRRSGDDRTRSIGRRTWALGFVAGSALATALWLSDWPLAFALVPMALGVSFVCLLALLRASRFDLPWLRAVGQASYSMYIVHFVFSWYAPGWIATLLPARLPPEAVWLMAFVLVSALSYAVALGLQRTVEVRGIELGRRLIARLRPRPTNHAGNGSAPAGTLVAGRG